MDNKVTSLEDKRMEQFHFKPLEVLSEGPVLDEDEMMRFIVKQTGMNMDDVVKVIQAETDYLIRVGVMEEA
ncbi:hypothetical protein EauS123_00033 [Exiguobacterium phage vB_EauS-123]|nr:hypothetical protein EauS123_00033 [Exiguobacterium phage vB_EauS-123]